MAETFPNPNDIQNQATEAANQFVNDLPNPLDLVPKAPEIPDLKSLIPKLPIPSFKKPQKIKVEIPPLPRKLTKQTKIPKIPKLPEPPNIQGAVANSLASVQGAVGNVTSAAQGAVGNITNNLPNI